jgi:hypothetical protein
MMEVERVSKTLGSCPELTQLVVKEHFTQIIRRESFNSQTVTNLAMVWKIEVMSKKFNVDKAKLNFILEI